MLDFNLFFALAVVLFSFNLNSGIGFADSANILAIFPGSIRSHYLIGKVLFSELADRGHKITLISPYKLSEPIAGIDEIGLDGVEIVFEEFGLSYNLNTTDWTTNPIERTTNLIYGTASLADLVLRNTDVQELLRSDRKFDLLIIDQLMTDSLLGIANYYQIPSIIFNAGGTHKWTDEPVANPNNPAFNPHTFLGYTDKMSLCQRLINSAIYIFDEISYRYFYLPAQETIYRRYFSDLKPAHQTELPSLTDLIHNVSLVFVNSHSAVQYPRPYVPNMIEIGGMHIQKEVGLSEDISRMLDEPRHGAIYFSLGGNIKSKDLPAEKREAFVKAFGSLVGVITLWKWENATLKDQPGNVIIGPWLPQQDILAHPRVNLFITHGGILSSMEAVHYATPTIGIPLFNDQKLNVQNAVDRGYSRMLDYNNITAESIREAIDDVLFNPKYRENVKKLSERFRDNPVGQLEKAIYYVEYVLRTNGAHHLRTAAVDLPLYQFLLVDVGLIILAIILVIIAVPSIIIGIILRKNNNPPVIANGGNTTSSGTRNRRPSNNNKLKNEKIKNKKSQ